MSVAGSWAAAAHTTTCYQTLKCAETNLRCDGDDRGIVLAAAAHTTCAGHASWPAAVGTHAQLRSSRQQGVDSGMKKSVHWPVHLRLAWYT